MLVEESVAARMARTPVTAPLKELALTVDLTCMFKGSAADFELYSMITAAA